MTYPLSIVDCPECGDRMWDNNTHVGLGLYYKQCSIYKKEIEEYNNPKIKTILTEVKDVDIKNNYKNWIVLKSYIGKKYIGDSNFMFFGYDTTNKIEVYLDDDKITRICIYSDLKWNGKSGEYYGGKKFDTDNFS